VREFSCVVREFSCVVEGVTRKELEIQGLKQLEIGVEYLGFLVTLEGTLPSEGKLMHMHLFLSYRE